MNLVQLACPLCDGLFQVDSTWTGTQVACPHCEQAVTVPEFEAETDVPHIDVESDVERQADSKPVPVDPGREPPAPKQAPAEPQVSAIEALKLARRMPDAEAGESPFAVRDKSQTVQDSSDGTADLRRKTPEQRARFRARLHIAVALAGALLLAVLMFVLLQLG